MSKTTPQQRERQRANRKKKKDYNVKDLTPENYFRLQRPGATVDDIRY